MTGSFRTDDLINRKALLRSCHPPSPSERLIWRFLRGEVRDNTSEDREKSRRNLVGDCRDQCVNLSDEVVGSHDAGYAIGQPNPGERGQPIVFQTKNSSVRDSCPHDGRNSWVESTMEVRLGHFIDPTHQGSQPHGGFFGNGKL